MVNLNRVFLVVALLLIVWNMLTGSMFGLGISVGLLVWCISDEINFQKDKQYMD